jgi:site-specific DNA-methyltransferase (adenine-specific)
MSKYQVIYADPPWHFSSKFKVGTEGKEQQSLDKFQYPTMKDKELKNYFQSYVANLADTDSVLIMWTTDAHLQFAIELGNLAGFTYKTIAFIWNKKTATGKQVCFMGTWTMKGSEIALLFTKGNAHKLLKSRKVRQLVESERREHSRKPDSVRASIEEMFPDVKRIELFARTKSANWEVQGNQTNKFL